MAGLVPGCDVGGAPLTSGGTHSRSVSAALESGADLVVTEVKGPENVGNGQPFTASVKVCNQGTEPTGSGSYHWPRVELYLSTDSELTIPDPSSPDLPMDQVFLGWVSLDQPLYPGQCVTKSVDAEASVPPAAGGMDGAYYLGAVVDTRNVEQELREDNNVRVGGLMGVGDGADLVVSAVTAPASVEMGQGFTVSVTVCNQGTLSTDTFSSPLVRLFLSMDTEVTLPTPDQPYPPPMDQVTIGFVELNQPLPAGQCVTEDVNVHAGRPPEMQGPGALYLAVAVDTMNAEQELREDNNLWADTLLQFTF
ncbi:CARDB domain-containing protein [Archangium violaceum]|uniref:CARDB domain-containing protein n=1 Tax=Archangium violaceum TaxID=83451 RepID=UPI000697A67A|nr:CARDB domain-containing protein [Archangium violaceum]